MVAELVLTFLVTLLSAVLVALLVLRPAAAQEQRRAYPTADTTERWARLVLQHRRIRKLQRLYHNSGQHLQTYPRSLLQRLTRQHLAAERRR